MENGKIIVVGDVHGRTFWKNIIGRKETIIFLGDYVDNYPDEGISNEEELDNLKDLLAFAQENKDRVTLLLGNHDQQYFFNDRRCMTNRYNRKNANEYIRLYQENEDLFKASVLIGDVLFTHAGVAEKFQERYKITKEHAADKLNLMLDNNDFGFSDIGYRRGGWCEAGSITWSDFMEKKSDDWYQVFAHTQCAQQKPIISDKFAMLDARRPFLMDVNTHEITEMDGTEIPKTDLEGIVWL